MTLTLITGGHSGIGLETARQLRDLGHDLVAPARQQLDLADLDSVRAFADEFLSSGRRIDRLICNAGIMAAPETRVGDGWESQFAVNHLGHYALVNLLWPAIAPGARVIVLASGPGSIAWDDPQFGRGYDKWAAYGQSKAANRLFAVELDRRGAPGVRAFSVTPGYILTPLQRHLTREEMVEAGWTDLAGNPVHPAFITPAEGAATTVWAATTPALDGLGGLHLERSAVVGPIDATDAERLWAYSAELTGIDLVG
jgi:NAD(P)-dependent dehydrogenase (short-subunit alcohol dehydrogenase family)